MSRVLNHDTDRPTTPADALAHYGVKGMKWGVRSDRGHEGERAKTKTIAKADKKYDKSLRGMNGFIKVNNAIADKINPRLDALNAKEKYSNVDMTKPEHAALHKQYLKDYRGELQKSLNEVMDDIGVNASGTKRLELEVYGEGMETTWQARMSDIKHAEAKDVTDGFVVVPEFDSNGQITAQVVRPMDEVQHFYGEGLDRALSHYGVKGMKWGVSRSRSKREGRLERVASGKGSKMDKLRVAATEVSSMSVAKNGGLKGAAANKVANMKAVDARLAERGQASVGDILKRFGGDRLVDLGTKDRSRR